VGDLGRADSRAPDIEPPAGRPAQVPALRSVLAAAAVGGVLALTAVTTTVFGMEPTPAPASAAVTATSTVPTGPDTTAAVERTPWPPAPGSDSTAVPARIDVDPESPAATAYLAALRKAEIPTSRSGLAETEAAAVICEQLDRGADEDALVRSLPAVLPTVTKRQAADVVDIAQEFYC